MTKVTAHGVLTTAFAVSALALLFDRTRAGSSDHNCQ